MRDFFAQDGVHPIRNSDCYWLLLNKHYARRIPSISYAFGLWRNGGLAGVVTYGKPAASTVRTGLLGPDMADRVIELNRLCLDENRPNDASHLVGRSLKMLPKPCAVISYADCEQGHLGYVYQATNFLYCGLSEKRTDWALRGNEGKHGQSVADEMRGVENRAEAMRKKYGDAFYLKPRSRKHRYVFLCGSRKDVKTMRAQLRYPVLAYPKELFSMKST